MELNSIYQFDFCALGPNSQCVLNGFRKRVANCHKKLNETPIDKPSIVLGR